MKLVKRTFFITTKEDKKLESLSRKNKVSKSEIVRQGIDELRDDHKVFEVVVNAKSFSNQHNHKEHDHE